MRLAAAVLAAAACCLLLPQPAGALDLNSLKYTNRAAEVFNGASRAAMTDGRSSFGPATLAMFVFGETPKGREDSLGTKICAHAEVEKALVIKNLKKVADKESPKQKPAPTSVQPNSELKRVMMEADRLRDENGDSFIAVHHFVLACASSENVKKALAASGLSKTGLEQAVHKLRKNKKVDKPSAEDTFEVLEKYGRDLVSDAEKGKLDPVIGRDEEIRRVIQVRSLSFAGPPSAFLLDTALLERGLQQTDKYRPCRVFQVLSRRTKNNPALLGEPGVGKTAIAEGLAQRIHR
eukprot:SAG22_NODE_263_length_13359_cov_3.396531_10_plen_293_part_00